MSIRTCNMTGNIPLSIIDGYRAGELHELNIYIYIVFLSLFFSLSLSLFLSLSLSLSLFLSLSHCALLISSALC